MYAYILFRYFIASQSTDLHVMEVHSHVQINTIIMYIP